MKEAPQRAKGLVRNEFFMCRAHHHFVEQPFHFRENDYRTDNYRYCTAHNMPPQFLNMIEEVHLTLRIIVLFGHFVVYALSDPGAGNGAQSYGLCA
jgi:hypothetical protein